jgi:hypothetical protein
VGKFLVNRKPVSAGPLRTTRFYPTHGTNPYGAVSKDR